MTDYSMSKRIFIFVITALLTLGVLIGGFLFFRPTHSPSPQLSTVAGQSVQVVIDFGTEQNDESVVPYKPTLTAFSALEAALDGKNYPLDVDRSSGLGVFVRAIGSRTNGDDKKFWQYWVNGAFPLIASDKYYLIPNDVVEWKFAEEKKMK